MSGPTTGDPERAHLLFQLRRLEEAINQIDGNCYLVSKSVAKESDSKNGNGFTTNEIAFLYAMNDDLPHSQIEISTKWLIPKTTVNTIVRKYKERGYLTLECADEHRREKQILLTESGKELCERVLSPIYNCELTSLKKTIQKHGETFIEAFNDFSNFFESEMNTLLNPSSEQPPSKAPPEADSSESFI